MGIMSFIMEAGEKLLGHQAAESAAAQAQAEPADESTWPTMAKGDTPSAVSAVHDGNANPPRLSQPDKICPGRLLRIPA